MPKGFGVSVDKASRPLNGVPIAFRYGALTEEERVVRQKAEAMRDCPAFGTVMLSAKEIQGRVLEVLKVMGPVGCHHAQHLMLMSITLADMLLTDEAMRAARKGSGAEEWFEPGPCRIACSLAVGAGKTLLSASTARLVADLVKSDPKMLGIQTRGLLYTASSIQLLGGMCKAMEDMGVPSGMVGVFHGDKTSPVPSIDREDVGKYPILLVTQQRLAVISSGARGSSVDRELAELLVYRGKERLTIWDEAFRSALADTAEVKAVVHAASMMQGELDRFGGVLDRYNKVLLGPEEGTRILGLLNTVCDKALEGVSKRTRGAEALRASPFEVPFSERESAILEELGSNWSSSKAEGPGEAVEALGKMAVAGGLDVSLLRSRRDHRVVVRPRVVIADRLQRLVILDAGYRTSLISGLDPTVKLAAGAEYAGQMLEAKMFHGVTVHCYRAHSGRGRTGVGLGNARVRAKVIADQVRRVSKVPPGEKSLVVTFKQRGMGPNFRAEIEAELNTVTPGWNGAAEGLPRVTIIEWGGHVGLNDWRECRHLFFVGVLRRDWPSDLSGQAFASARGDMDRLQGIDPLEVEANQAAEEIMQAIGRGNARATINGEAGEMWVHLPYMESQGRFIGLAPCEGSPLYEHLSRMMPGCKITSESEPPAASGAEMVADMAGAILEERAVDRMLSGEVKRLTMEALAAAGVIVSDQVCGNGLKLLQQRNEVKAVEGLETWLKPTPTSRAWERRAPGAAAVGPDVAADAEEDPVVHPLP